MNFSKSISFGRILRSIFRNFTPFAKRRAVPILLMFTLITALSGCAKEASEPIIKSQRNRQNTGKICDTAMGNDSENITLRLADQEIECLDERFFVPFLTAREDGSVHMEEALTKDDLLYCLSLWLEDQDVYGRATEGVEEAMMDTEDVSVKVLKEALADLPEAEDLENVLSSKGLSDPVQTITRGSFAEIMVETFRFTDFIVRFEPIKALPFDLDIDNDALLLATQPYTVKLEVPDRFPIKQLQGTITKEPKCEGITKAFLNAEWPEGFSFARGHLYYADENGTLMRNDTLGTHLFFGEDGKQTSGDDELDKLTAEKIFGYMLADPEGTRYTWLRTAFMDVARNTWYYPGVHPDYGNNCDDEWLIPFALTGLDSWRGDCYVYAASFTVLARALGYDAHANSGIALDAPSGPHSWTIIHIDPKNPLDIIPGEAAADYFYDPQMGAHIMAGTIGAGLRCEYMFEFNSRNAHEWWYKWTKPEETCP